MSTTQASQTLFRFVSVRNPQLTDDSGKEKRFVYRPLEVKNQPAAINVFDAAIIAGSTVPKLELLKTAAIAFKTSAAHLEKDVDVKQLVGTGIYDFSIWLARNRDSYISTEIVTKAAEAGAVLNTNVLTSLWNNLFYQVVTQESFYVKEAIMQVLIANHVIANIDHDLASKGITNNQTAAKATVILPKELFLDTTNANAIGISSKTAAPDNPKLRPPTVAMKKNQAVLSAEFDNKNYSELKKSIEKIEQNYRKAYSEAYAIAHKEYEKTTKPILEKFALEKDAAFQTWCANRKVTDAPVAENDPCNRPPLMAEPDVPAFEFTFQSEKDYLQSKLTPEQIKLINNIGISENNSNAATKNLLENESILVDDFSDLYSNINNSVAQNNNTIVSNIANDDDGLVIIGGVPISTTARDASTNFEFQLCSRFIPYLSVYFWDLSFSVPDYSWVVDDIAYTHKDLNNSPTLNHYVTNYRNGNTIHLNDLFANWEYLFYSNVTYNEINGTIHFTNGKTRTFKVDVSTGVYDFCIVDDLIDPENTGGGGTGASPMAFKPSGFGVKQLGIADYKKVEQTVHCYVEGEVAHIENIMAREYREKSTRRLRRSENTTTTSSESEREHLSDTTSTDRFEMQNEVAKVMQNSRDFSANASVTYDNKTLGITANAGANYASHNSKEESTRAAVTQAKDITERAMDRVVSRVKQERIEKVIEEFEENNKHGFDNTKGDKHVVGVYRWVDKIYKNQIYNYGKRLMFEFMIPEPAKLHYLGMVASKDNASGKKIIEPKDPRKAGTMSIATSVNIDESKAKYWASKFNVDIENKLEETIKVTFAFSDTKQGVDFEGYGRISGGYSNTNYKY